LAIKKTALKMLYGFVKAADDRHRARAI
jgi:hypothetical protein